MFPALFGSTTIPVLEKLVNFSQARHNVLAGNIANLDTPGYRTRDLSPDSFQEQMRAFVEARHTPAMPGSPGMAAFETLSAGPAADDMSGLLRHDDANVDIEQQITEIAKNQMQHNVALSIMKSQFRLLEAAISERA